MQAAFEQAQLGFREGGVPIGAVLVYQNAIIGRGRNRRQQRGSVVLHAEMDALEAAGRQPASVYRQCVMYTTLSPCPMCSGALILYEIPKVIVGENRTFLGAEDWLRTQGAEVMVLDNAECYSLMQAFIRKKPGLWAEDIGVEPT